MKRDLVPTPRKEITQLATRHPLTVLPAVAGAVGMGLVLLAGPSFGAVALAAGGLGLALLSWIVNVTLRSGLLLKQVEERAIRELEEREREKMSELRQSFVRLKFDEKVDRLAEQALEQLEGLEAKRAAFGMLLGQKFSLGELTYDRYLGAVDQAYGAVLANLRRLPPLLSHANTLEASPILDRQRERVDTLFDENAKTLAAIDQVVAALAAIGTSREGGPSDLDGLIEELRALAERARKYSS